MARKFQLTGDGALTLPTGCVDGEACTTTSGRKIALTSMRHLHSKGSNLGFAIGATPTTREEIVYVARTAGIIRNFSALCYDTGSSASVTFDLKKNGTTVLSGVVTVTNATVDKAVVAGSISGTTYVAGDIFSIALTVSSATGMVGPYAWAEFDETAV